MRPVLLAIAALMLVPAAAAAQGTYGVRGPYDPDTTGSVSGRAPWNRPSEFDSGSDNDRRPELPYYQQGRGQQTGGPERNRLPYDGFTLGPR